MNEKKVLVTGGCGFIGSHLVGRLLKLVEEVVIIDNMSGGKARNLQTLQNSSRLRVVEGDLLNVHRCRTRVRTVISSFVWSRIRRPISRATAK